MAIKTKILEIKKNKEGQIHESDLTNKEWEYIKKYLPKPAKTGRPKVNNREVINGILYFLSTAIRWNDMPKYYPSGTTCWRRLKDYSEKGIWINIFEGIQKRALEEEKINFNNSYLDGSPASSKKGVRNT